MSEQPENITDQPDGERDRAICDRAYAIWCEKGYPEGQDREHWLTAAKEYDARDVPGEGSREDEELSARPSPRT